MPDTIARVRDLLNARLSDLSSEINRLERVLGNLASADGAAPSRPATRRRRRRSSPRKAVKATKPAARKAGKRAPRGQRRQEFVAALQQSPGAKASEIAKQLGISANQAGTLARRLQQQGAIRKSGNGYRLATKA